MHIQMGGGTSRRTRVRPGKVSSESHSPSLKDGGRGFFFFFFLSLFIIFIFGCTGSLLLKGFSLVVASGGYSSLGCADFSWLLLLQSIGSRHLSFNSCSS